MKTHTYVMQHTAPDGTVTNVQAKLSGDTDARNWGKAIVERDGGSVTIPLQDGTTFICP